jgi:hypothetical protein
VPRLSVEEKRANTEGESWRLLFLLNVIAKCLEAFVCDLGQRDAIQSIDPLNFIFQFSRDPDGQASILLDVGLLPEGIHGFHTNIYGNDGGKFRHFYHFLQRIQKFPKNAGHPCSRKAASRAEKS